MAESREKDGGIEIPPSSDSAAVAPEQEGENVAPEPPFSIFSSRQKLFITTMASLAALFSPISTVIYYPALDTLAKEFDVSFTLINLTVTSYLVRHQIPPKAIS
jgi:hypothetical protein